MNGLVHRLTVNYTWICMQANFELHYTSHIRNTCTNFYRLAVSYRPTLTCVQLAVSYRPPLTCVQLAVS